MPSALSLLIRILSNESFIYPSAFRRLATVRAAAIYCEIEVAIATPATPILKTITKMRLQITLKIPEIVKKYIGLLESPIALKSAEPKL